MDDIQSIIESASRLQEEMDRAMDNLVSYMAQEHQVRRELAPLQEELRMAEAEIVLRAEEQARDKQGPLAGLAKTGKAYGLAIDLLLHRERTQGRLADLHRRVQSLQAILEDVAHQREMEATRLAALKRAAYLQAAILEALAAER